MRDIPGLEGRYAATIDGRIWSHRRKRFRTPAVQASGYLTIGIKESDGRHRTLSVHRLVAITWLPNPEGLPQINHKDGVKANCAVANLEWCTSSENISHAWRTGLSRRTPAMAESLKRAVLVRAQTCRKLSDEQLAAARERVAAGERITDLAKEHGMSKWHFGKRIRGENYRTSKRSNE